MKPPCEICGWRHTKKQWHTWGKPPDFDAWPEGEWKSKPKTPYQRVKEWRKRHPDKYRAQQRDLMRERRAKQHNAPRSLYQTPSGGSR